MSTPWEGSGQLREAGGCIDTSSPPPLLEKVNLAWGGYVSTMSSEERNKGKEGLGGGTSPKKSTIWN